MAVEPTIQDLVITYLFGLFIIYWLYLHCNLNKEKENNENNENQ